MYGPMDSKKKHLDELMQYAQGEVHKELKGKYGPPEPPPEQEAVPGAEGEEGMSMEASGEGEGVESLLAGLSDEEKAALLEALKSA